MEELYYSILKWLITFVLGTIFGYISTKLKKEKAKNDKEKEKNKALEKAVQALLRNELIRRYREYKTKKEMTILDRENIEHMYEEYIHLDGNGTVKQLMEELLDVPTKVIRE